MKKRLHAAGLGGWGVSDIGGFVVGGVWGAAFEDALKGEVEEGPGCSGFDVRVLAEIPLMIKKAAAAV